MLDYESIEFLEHPEPKKFRDIKLPQIIREVFKSKGIDKLYDYQADAIELSRQGKNIVIQAPTAGGKTEVYLVRAVEEALKGFNTIILYPTKALSRDQTERFSPFSLYGISTAVYDGDTPQSRRKKIRENPPKILITNVDMLHHILLNHTIFTKFFRNLKLVVVDELHYYSGTLGSHLANILKRLKRIISTRFKNRLNFIATSATIENPKEFAELVFAEDVEVISVVKSNRKVKHILINPSESYISASLKIAEKLDKKTLIFADSHLLVEKIAYIGKKRGLKITSYRAGLPPDVRRQIENKFKRGDIRILVTTSALELGMDIGNVDVVIMAGFPGSISRARQRSGRAGRKGQLSYSIMVARDNPLDQYYIDNPENFFKGKPESCYANPENEEVLKYHVLAMASELMLKEGEEREMVDLLLKEGLLKKLGPFYAPTPKGRLLARTLNLRGIGERISIFNEDGALLGSRELPVAMRELYEGALYFINSKPYFSLKLDLKGRKAIVSKADDVDYYTTPLSERSAEVIEEKEFKEIDGLRVAWGTLHIADSVIGYVVREEFSKRKVAQHYFDEPYVYEFDTTGLWIDMPEEMLFNISNFGYGLHAFEHVFINMTPAVAGNNPSEVGGLSLPEGRMYMYESVPNGISRIVFRRFKEVAEMTFNRLSKCKCENGCPKCILDPHCGNDNQYLDKKAAIEISKDIILRLSS